MPTRRQQIVEAFAARLEAIATAEGFDTDAGQAVFVNEAPGFGPDDGDAALVLVVGDEGQEWQQAGKACVLTLPLTVQAVARSEIADSWLLIEALIGDVKLAVELEDRTLGSLLLAPLRRGPVRSLTREPGSAYVGSQVTYTAQFKEGWGQP